jgi:hypothetical protein
MTTEEIYTDALDGTYSEWAVLGSTPYLQNTDTDYIRINLNAKTEGDWTFPASDGSGTINSVKLRFEAMVQAVNSYDATVYVWDGASWVNIGDLGIASTSYAWYEKDVSAILNTWAKINGAKVRLVSWVSGAAKYIYVRRLTRKVDYSAAIIGGIQGDGLTFATT